MAYPLHEQRGVLTPITSLTSLTPQGARTRARTILGWTPGLRNLVSGTVLPCGCLVGTYETWTRSLITIVDERGRGCGDDHHQANAIL
jgi:hypothetical protein